MSKSDGVLLGRPEETNLSEILLLAAARLEEHPEERLVLRVYDGKISPGVVRVGPDLVTVRLDESLDLQMPAAIASRLSLHLAWASVEANQPPEDEP